jgi:hypothetical protein
MPPVSYIGVAILLVMLVASGAADRLPLVVYQWHALFLAVPCLLAVPDLASRRALLRSY